MFGIFKKKDRYNLPKKNKMVVDSNKSLEEIAEDFSKMEFQWIKGDFVGNQEFFHSLKEEGDLKYLQFKSGNRINLDLLPDYMESFPYSGNPPVDNKQGQIQQKKGSAEIKSVKYSAPEKIQNTASPIYNLLSKQKPNMVDVSISIKLNLPPKDLYDVLIGSFDEAEDDIVEYIISSIEIDDIKKAISSSIVDSYYSRPKSNKKPIEKTRQENE